MAKSNKVEQITPSVLDERLEKLKKLFPEFFTEGKLDVPKLQEFLGEAVEEETERYHFTWAGKQEAINMLQTPTRATLVPCPEESVDFNATGNIFVEGDNLEVLKLLYKPYFGDVKAIYIDPPYNTGGKFVYSDDYKDPLRTYLRITGQIDEEGNIGSNKVEKSGRFHSNWLSMMYPRLFLARQLLKDDGIIFVSIDDHEVYNLQMLMNGIFGEENYIGGFVWRKKAGAGSDTKLFFRQHEHILMYARNKEKIGALFQPLTEKQRSEYKNPDNDPRGRWAPTDLTRADDNDPARTYEVVSPKGAKFTRCWTYTEENFQKLIADNLVWWGKHGKSKPKKKRFLEKKEGLTPRSWVDIALTSDGKKDLKKLDFQLFDYPKPVELIKHFLLITTKADDLILDFFAGSCTTAQAVLELNRENGGTRRFIMVQLPEKTPEDSDAKKAGYETISDIGKERIRRVIANMQEDEELAESEDLGVKVFKLAKSNYRLWNGVEEDTPESYAKQLQLFSGNPLITDWKSENVIYEIAIKEGYPLNSLVEQVKGIKRNTIFRVTSAEQKQAFYICLDNELFQDEIDKLGLTSDDLFICFDQALDDTKVSNLALNYRLKTI